MNDYMEEQLSEDDQAQCDQHLVGCPNCSKELMELKLIQEVLQEVPMKALPENFTSSLHEKLLLAAQENHSEANAPIKNNVTTFSAFQAFKSRTTAIMNNKRTWQMTSFAAVACLALVIGMNPMSNPFTEYKTAENVEGAVGQSVTFDSAMPADNGMVKTGNMQYGAVPNAEPPESSPLNATTKLGTRASVENLPQTATVTPHSQRDMIYNGSINIEVTSQTDSIAMIKSHLAQKNGYIENSSFGENPLYYEGRVTSYQKFGNLILRIPAIHFESSYEFIKSLGKVTNEAQFATDVTQVITDLEANIKNLEAREVSLRTLMKQAKNITEIMAVDKELTAVRTEIDQLKMSLRNNKSAVAMSTLTVNVTEVTKLTDKLSSKDGTFLERVTSGISDTLQYMRFWISEAAIKIIALSPLLISLSVIGIVFYKLIKHSRGGKKHE